MSQRMIFVFIASLMLFLSACEKKEAFFSASTKWRMSGSLGGVVGKERFEQPTF